MGPTEEACRPPVEFARDLIRRKARRLASRGGFTRSDREDLEQELTLDLLARWGAFRPERASPEAFAQLVVGHAADSLLRHGAAKKRSAGVALPLAGPAAPVGDASDPVKARDLRLDLEALLSRLPEGDRELATSLLTESQAEAARRLGLPRSTLRSRLARLRARFEDAGLRDYLRK